MIAPRFLQIHTLHSYTAALLNRDDTGQAKRLVYGGAIRTRISSQCLKRHWRMAREEKNGRLIKDDPFALQNIAGYVDSFRSRELVTEKVITPLNGFYPEDVVKALNQWFQYVVYSGSKDGKPKKRAQDSKAENPKERPILLYGEPEMAWLAGELERLAREAAGDADKAFQLGGQWAEKYKENIKTLRGSAALPGGITAALFGRMVTSDPAANIDAPVHVAHAFTVHETEDESDFLAAVDDLTKDAPGAGTIQETELTSGLYYGYAVIDMPGLIGNCGGDRDLASRIVYNLVHLIAEVSPGAKLGSTAPYGRAGLVLGEVGARQPRSLASAYRKAVKHDFDEARDALRDELRRYDESYATGEARRHLCVEGALDGIEKVSLKQLAEWAAACVLEAPDA